MLTPTSLCGINFWFPKRNKGRARKAKAQTKDTQSATVVADNAAEDEPKEMIILKSWFTRRLQDVVICSHSCPPLPAAHVGNTIIDAFVNQSYALFKEDHTSDVRTGATLTRVIEEFESKHPDIWADTSIRELIGKSFLGRSVDIVLQTEDEGYLMAAGMLATASLMLEPDYGFNKLNAKQQLKLQMF